MVSHRDWTPILKWYMARFVVKNGHQKVMCYNEIRLLAQNILIILGSGIKTDNWEALYNRLKWKKIFT